MTASVSRRGLNGNGRKLSLARSPLFDYDDLPAPVKPAARANMVRPLHLTAIPASHQVDRGDEIVAAAVALAMSADSLLGKRTHD